MATQSAEQSFLNAWRAAARLIGAECFKNDPDSPDITSKWDLEPVFDMFKARLGTASSGERLFMLAVYQFYNSKTFKERPSLNELAYSLDAEHLSTLVRLMASYRGW